MTVVRLDPAYFPNPIVGRPVPNGYIYVGEVDLDPKVVTNQKQISVLQEDGSTVDVSQPLRTSKGGVTEYNGSPVTVTVIGNYSLKVLDSGGSQVYYVPKNIGALAVLFLSDYDSLSAAITAIGATEAELWIDKDDELTGSVVSPATLKIRFVAGYVVSGAYTWTINGDIESGLFTTFGTDITIEGLKTARPEWWGIDGAADEIEINKASLGVEDQRGTVLLSYEYLINDSVLLRDNVSYLGIDKYRSLVKFQDGATGAHAFYNSTTVTGNDNWVISKLKMDSNRSVNGSLGAGVETRLSSNNHIHDCYITGFVIGIELEGEEADGSTNNIIENNIIDDFGTGGTGFGIILIRGATNNTVFNNRITSTETNNCIAVDDFSSSGDSYDSRYNIISNNILNGGGDGVRIEGCSNNIVIGNIIRNSSEHSVTIKEGTTGDNLKDIVGYDNIVSNNVLRPTSVAVGVYLRDNQRTNIINNNIRGGTRSVFLFSVPIDFNIIGNNLSGFSESAVYCDDGGQRFNISDNIINGELSSGFGEEGIFLTSNGASMKWGAIKGNIFTNIGLEAIKVWKGTSALGDISITDNMIISASQASVDTYYAINILGVVGSVDVKDNKLVGGSDALGLALIDNEAIFSLQSGNSPEFNTWDFSSFAMKQAKALSGTLAGATDKINTNIPAGGLIMGISMNNDDAVVDDGGDNTYTAAFSGGLTVAINGGSAIAAAQNTKTKEMFDINAAPMIVASDTDITFTPNGGNFTAGEITAVVWYLLPEDLPDAS